MASKTQNKTKKTSVKTQKSSVKAVETVIKIDKTAIPKGDSKEDIKKREKIIKEFYKQWAQIKRGNCKEDCRYCKKSCRKVYNKSLKENIYVKQISVTDTVEHSSKSYLSTLAVLQLDTILQLARKIDTVKASANSNNQNVFEKMILMECEFGGRKVSLKVGVKRSDKTKVQYCITAIR